MSEYERMRADYERMRDAERDRILRDHPEHQRVQAEAAALLKEVEEWANPGQGMGSGLHAEKWPPLSRAARAEMKALLARCSSAGAALLEELSEARAQREAMTDNRHRLISERDAARTESADLRARLERAEKERDDCLTPDEALAQLGLIKQEHTAEVRRAVEQEREACAVVADGLGCVGVGFAIRARGKGPEK